LQEYYYSNTNKSAFKTFCNNIKNIILIEQELISCSAAFEMVKLGDESGFEILKKWKITTTDHQSIQSAILRKETKLELARNKLEQTGKDEKIGFYKIVSSVESSLNRQLNLGEINLERWVAYLNDVKERNETIRNQNNKANSRNGRQIRKR